jgi:phosphoribosylformylglycinamidine synthase
VFLPPDATLRLPVAHAEGKIVVRDDETLVELRAGGHVALRYVDPGGDSPRYPANPNGSVDHVAALTDGTGQVLGLMPHPERFVDPTQDPQWTRRSSGEPDGLVVFRSAVARFR